MSLSSKYILCEKQNVWVVIQTNNIDGLYNTQVKGVYESFIEAKDSICKLSNCSIQGPFIVNKLKLENIPLPETNSNPIPKIDSKPFGTPYIPDINPFRF